MSAPMVGIIMGSKSDLGIMKEAAQVLEELGIEHELTVLSAHRTPHRVIEYAESARTKGLKVIIAGAGMAAHLPGVIAALTTLPVIGVPVIAANSPGGLDSVLSILQMPPGIPVAAVAMNGARNAGILAAEVIAVADKTVKEKLDKFRDSMKKKAEDLAEEIEKKGYKSVL
ncbi:MAG TPA: 5-(carboxyamino)imidazole ribonucleotide mutase [Cyclobacteriaceae bacterium]|nr:5-(carboxyamino)imidazole ribonucleotide mutase [Cyclobacteriaceae bacterium]